jgi:hypothetical protein
MQPRSLPTHWFVSTRCYISSSSIGKSVHLLFRQTMYIILPSASWSPQWSLSVRLPHQHPVHTSILPHTRPCNILEIYAVFVDMIFVVYNTYKFSEYDMWPSVWLWQLTSLEYSLYNLLETLYEIRMCLQLQMGNSGKCSNWGFCMLFPQL